MKININHFVSILKTGKTLLYPTDTIWGLGCDATNQAAVAKIYTLKKRKLSKPLIALVADVNMLSNYVSDLPENIHALLKSEVPTTLVYPKGKGLAKGVMAHNGMLLSMQTTIMLLIPLKRCFLITNHIKL